MDWEFYGIGKKPLHWSIGQVFTSIFFGADSFRSMFRWAANSIFFAPETSIETKGKAFYVPLSSYQLSEIKNHGKKREGHVWFARLIDNEKGIKALIKLANINKNITIYGAGKDEKMLHNNLNDPSIYKGYLKNDDVASMLQKKKTMVMTSNYEGFPVTIVESLSQGTPVVMFDTFASAKYFEKSGAIFLFKKGDIQGMNKKLNEIDAMSKTEYKKLSDKAIKFAKENLSIEAYEKNIQKVLDSVGQ